MDNYKIELVRHLSYKDIEKYVKYGVALIQRFIILLVKTGNPVEFYHTNKGPNLGRKLIYSGDLYYIEYRVCHHKCYKCTTMNYGPSYHFYLRKEIYVLCKHCARILADTAKFYIEICAESELYVLMVKFFYINLLTIDIDCQFIVKNYLSRLMIVS